MKGGDGKGFCFGKFLNILFVDAAFTCLTCREFSPKVLHNFCSHHAQDHSHITLCHRLVNKNGVSPPTPPFKSFHCCENSSGRFSHQVHLHSYDGGHEIIKLHCCIDHEEDSAAILLNRGFFAHRTMNPSKLLFLLIC